MSAHQKAAVSLGTLLYFGSLVLHVGLAVGISLLPKQKKTEVVAISMAEGKKKGKDDKKPEPPKPMVEPPKPAAKAAHAPAPKPAAAAPPPEQQPQTNAPPPAPGMENLLDLGMMGNGGSGNGMALGAKSPSTPAPTATAVTTKKVETLAPVVDKCTEPTVKPRRKGGPQPSYTQQARQAEIEGQVRVQVTIDESGRVVAALIGTGLGYGLDEAALAAAKRWTFDPATKCGNPVTGATTLLFGFHLDR